MKLKNLNLYSDNITIFTGVYDDVFLVKCNSSSFQEIKNSHLEVDEIAVFVVKAFDLGLAVMNTNVKEITKDDFVNYLND